MFAMCAPSHRVGRRLQPRHAPHAQARNVGAEAADLRNTGEPNSRSTGQMKKLQTATLEIEQCVWHSSTRKVCSHLSKQGVEVSQTRAAQNSNQTEVNTANRFKTIEISK